MATITQKKVFASLPRTERGKAVRLTGKLQPKPDNSPPRYLYCNGNSVFIRDLKNSMEVDIYTKHSKQTTVARYAPSGFYIASGDESGKIQVWDTTNKEHITKCEFAVLGGAVRDIDWSQDSQRLAIGGAGNQTYAKVIMMDTGTTSGELFNIGKAVNTVALRQERPFRLVTASEDMKVVFFHGPPFKYERDHVLKNFANVARYAPDSSVVISGGADGRLFKYDGKDLELVAQIGDPAHKGGIYEVCFSADSKQVLSVSGDKTAKIFDVESGDCLQTFNMDSGRGYFDMLLGALWLDDEIIVVNALGHLTFLNRDNPGQPKTVIKGHNKPITALALTADKKTAFTAGQEGSIIYWDTDKGTSDQVCGKGHTSQVTDMIIDDDTYLISVSIDDTLRVTSVATREFSDIVIPMASQPQALACHSGTVVVVCANHIVVVDGGRSKSGFCKKEVERLTPGPACVSFHPDGATVAVGFKTGEIRIFSLHGGKLSQKQSLKMSGAVSSLSYSPDGQWLAFSSDRAVGVRDTVAYELVKEMRTKHTARVICLAWSPDSNRFATGGLDSSLYVWKKEMLFEERPNIKAHTMSHINKLAWLDQNTIITVGQDCNVKQFTVTSE